MDEIPVLALPHAENLPEQLLGLPAAQEVILVGRALIGVAGRDRHPHAELLGVVEKGGNVLRGMPVKDRSVDVDGEALGLGGLDRGDRAVEHTRLTDRFVVMLAQSVEVDREEQIGGRLEQVQLLLQQQRIRAQRDELLFRDQALHDLADLAMDQRLAAGNCDHGRAAFVDCVEALLDRQPAIENGIGIVDLAAADAGEIAAKQWFQHQDEWIAFAPQHLLPEDIGADTYFLKKRHLHFLSSQLNDLIRRKFAFCLASKRLNSSQVRAVTGTQYSPAGPAESSLRPHQVFAMC